MLHAASPLGENASTYHLATLMKQVGLTAVPLYMFLLQFAVRTVPFWVGIQQLKVQQESLKLKAFMQVGRYFNKIQCFCFEEQHLRPRESVDMPVFFYIDPEFATDRRLKNVDHITLSYVFFKTGDVPTHADGTELTPGESMPAHLLPSQQALKSGMQATAEASEQEVVEKSAAPKSCTDLEKSKRKQAGTTGANESNDTAASAGEQKVA